MNGSPIEGFNRRAFLIEEQGMTYLGEIEADHALTPLQAASCSYRIALGPRARAEGAQLAKRAQPSGTIQ